MSDGTLPDHVWSDPSHDLAWLQAQRDYPSVSMLLSTAPGADGLVASDRVRLDAMISDLSHRLRPDVGDEVADAVVVRLRALADAVESTPPSVSLALFASASVATSVALSVPVRERVVVDDTFATRDLVAHAHRSIRFRVLAVTEHHVRLFTGAVDRVRELTEEPYPLGRDDDEGADAWWRRVAAAVTAAPGEGPWVLVGVERTVADMRRRLDPIADGRVAGVVRGSPEHLSWQELHDRAWPVLEGWLDEQRSEALGRLDRARGARRYASGLDEVWALAGDGRVELLVVEEGFEVAARVSGEDIQPGLGQSPGLRG